MFFQIRNAHTPHTFVISVGSQRHHGDHYIVWSITDLVLALRKENSMGGPAVSSRASRTALQAARLGCAGRTASVEVGHFRSIGPDYAMVWSDILTFHSGFFMVRLFCILANSCSGLLAIVVLDTAFVLVLLFGILAYTGLCLLHVLVLLPVRLHRLCVRRCLRELVPHAPEFACRHLVRPPGLYLLVGLLFFQSALRWGAASPTPFGWRSS